VPLPFAAEIAVDAVYYRVVPLLRVRL